ncbi:MAG: hypothetical protein WKF94_15630 [Solirubrobacteraceae bacterium]
MLRRLVPVFLAALVLSGCGQGSSSDTGDFSGEEGAVAEVVGELGDSATRGEGAAVCDNLLSERLQEEVADETSCVSEVEKAFEDADGFIVEVREVAVEGVQATAEVRSEQVPEDVTSTFSFVKENDDWRIDSFG